MASKFERYMGKINFKVGAEELAIDFRVKDRVKLAEINEQKETSKKYEATIDFCQALMKRSYPAESDEQISSFLNTYIDEFVEELLVAAHVVTREQMNKQKTEVKKELGATAP